MWLRGELSNELTSTVSPSAGRACMRTAVSVFDKPRTTTRGMCPCTSIRSKIILADGVEDVQSHGALSERFDAMDNSAGDPPDVAGSQNPGDSSDGELELARDHDSHLLVRMGMIGNDGIGLEVHDREHDAAPGRGANLDSGE